MSVHSLCDPLARFYLLTAKKDNTPCDEPSIVCDRTAIVCIHNSDGLHVTIYYHPAQAAQTREFCVSVSRLLSCRGELIDRRPKLFSVSAPAAIICSALPRERESTAVVSGGNSTECVPDGPAPVAVWSVLAGAAAWICHTRHSALRTIPRHRPPLCGRPPLPVVRRPSSAAHRPPSAVRRPPSTARRSRRLVDWAGAGAEGKPRRRRPVTIDPSRSVGGWLECPSQQRRTPAKRRQVTATARRSPPLPAEPADGSKRHCYGWRAGAARSVARLCPQAVCPDRDPADWEGCADGIGRPGVMVY